MQILGTDNSGRITDLKIIGADKEVKIPAKDFRSIVGPNVIRSTNFGVSLVEDDIVFEGLGWGHGAGLCQWGAYFMAKQGRDYAAILRYYYPAAEIAQR
jgi:stage II sporulation protein D